VGRGLRLCVNSRGERQDLEACGEALVHSLNTLTVVASESYASFVAQLQSEIRSDLCPRPQKASAEYFADRPIVLANGETRAIKAAEATAIYSYLVRSGYVNDGGKVTDKYRADAEAGRLQPMRPDLAPLSDGVHKLVQAIFDPSALQDMTADGRGTKPPANPLNENWKNFKELWDKINKKYAYIVDFDSAALKDKCVEAINRGLFVSRLSYTVTKGSQEGAGFSMESAQTKTLDRAKGGVARYDVIGKVAQGAALTRRTAAAILGGLAKEKIAMLAQNPEEFIAKTIAIINGQKAAVVVDHIEYRPSAEEPYSNDIFNIGRASDEYAKAYKAKRAIQDYVFTDGAAENSVERRFAADLDTAEEVVVYAKLPKGPKGFYIPTPVGKYSPDWAISFRKGAVKHIFFIAETNGTMDSLELRPIEKAKIDCAKKLFNEFSTEGVKYHDVDSYQSLLAVMETL